LGPLSSKLQATYADKQLDAEQTEKVAQKDKAISKKL
jgi:hypothetical protein